MQSFQELNLSPELMRAITELGYTAPSPIQAQALPILLAESTDFMGLASTGTGKTAAFGIPMLERIDPKNYKVQALVLCPTRELAIQVSGQIDLLGKFLGIRSLPVYGGAGYGDQIKGLKRGVPIVVGTPGRVLDHVTRGTLSLSSLKLVVLDEADEMISMGFKEDLQAILDTAPKDGSRNTWLFSATMGPDIRRVADEYLTDPKQVHINRTEVLSESVEQINYVTQESNKPEVLCKLMDAVDDFYGLIFCQTKALVTDLTSYLQQRKYAVDCLHGDMNQAAREKTMQSFRDRKIKVLICTDVASRGLDVKDVTHVINYSLPREMDSYIHRIGRTARSGKAGIAMNLVTPSHRGLVSRIERVTKSKMKEGTIPTRREIGAIKIARILKSFQAQDAFTRAVSLMDTEWKTAIAEMTPEEVAGRFLFMMYPEVFVEQREPDRASAGRGAVVREPRNGDRAPGTRTFTRDPRDSRGEDRGGDRDRRPAPRSYAEAGGSRGFTRPRPTPSFSPSGGAMGPSPVVVRGGDQDSAGFGDAPIREYAGPRPSRGFSDRGPAGAGRGGPSAGSDRGPRGFGGPSGASSAGFGGRAPRDFSRAGQRDYARSGSRDFAGARDAGTRDFSTPRADSPREYGSTREQTTGPRDFVGTRPSRGPSATPSTQPGHDGGSRPMRRGRES